MADRDGLYVYVLKSGTISFRYNYSINGRQETPGAGPVQRPWHQARQSVGVAAGSEEDPRGRPVAGTAQANAAACGVKRKA